MLAKLQKVRDGFIDVDGEATAKINEVTGPLRNIAFRGSTHHNSVKDILNNYINGVSDEAQTIAALQNVKTRASSSTNSTPFLGLVDEYIDKVKDSPEFSDIETVLATIDIDAIIATIQNQGLTQGNGVYNGYINEATDLADHFFSGVQEYQGQKFIFLNFKRWVTDGNEDKSLIDFGLTPNSIQQNITAAITAGQNLNDTQKDKVRRFLFVFEEYYKSASAILTKITQIIQRMAQGIAR